MFKPKERSGSSLIPTNLNSQLSQPMVP